MLLPNIVYEDKQKKSSMCGSVSDFLTHLCLASYIYVGQLTIKSFLLITDDRKLKNELLLIVNHSVLFPKTSFSCRLDIARRGCHTGVLKYCTFFSLPEKAWSHPKGKLCQMLE